MMMERKLKGNVSNAVIAKEFNVNPATVERTLSWAKRAGLIVNYEDKILQELMPLAHQALKKALEKGNVEVALELLKGMLPTFAKKTAGNGPTATSGNELASYIDQLRSELGVIEGELANESTKALPPATKVSIEEIAAHLSGGLPAGPQAPQEGTPEVGTEQFEGTDSGA